MIPSQAAQTGVQARKRRELFSSDQIVEILRAHEKGVTVPQLCRQYGISPTTFYKWRAKFGPAEKSKTSPEKTPIALLEEANRRLKTLEEENHRLKTLLAEMVLENSILKEMLGKSEMNE